MYMAFFFTTPARESFVGGTPAHLEAREAPAAEWRVSSLDIEHRFVEAPSLGCDWLGWIKEAGW